jgi:hypothetical protein
VSNFVANKSPRDRSKARGFDSLLRRRHNSAKTTAHLAGNKNHCHFRSLW